MRIGNNEVSESQYECSSTWNLANQIYRSVACNGFLMASSGESQYQVLQRKLPI